MSVRLPVSHEVGVIGGIGGVDGGGSEGGFGGQKQRFVTKQKSLRSAGGLALAAWFQNMNVPLEVSKHTPKSVVLVMEASTKKTEPSPYRVDISTQNACVCCIGSTICEASHHFDSIGGAGGGEGESYVACVARSAHASVKNETRIILVFY